MPDSLTMQGMADNITGERIRRVRNQLKHRQDYLAFLLEQDHDLKISQSDISKIEQGKRYVKDFELNAIAYALNVSPSWLLRGDEAK